MKTNLHRSLARRFAGLVSGLVVLCLASVATAGPNDLQAVATPPPGPSQPLIDAAFARQAEGATLSQVREALAPAAGDDAVDFALGTLDFLLATEGMLQAMHRHDALGTFREMREFAGPQGQFLAWIGNLEPAETTMVDVGLAVSRWTEGLAAADRTLAAAGSDFRCAIQLPAIRFDLNADGVTTEREQLAALFELFPPIGIFDRETRRRSRVPMVADDLVVVFDGGDAAWLRGYCRLLQGVGNMVLAHDWTSVFEHCGHVIFPRAKTPYPYLAGSTWSLERFTGMPTPAPFDLTDAIALIGNMRLPMVAPERMQQARGHFLACVAHGRTMWERYDAETDNDREWIPNPRQTAAFHDVRVDEDMRGSWLLLLEEVRALLEGERVLRFWRGDGTRGIDLKRVFEEPREFDLLYWVQGSAAGPYLRAGEFTAPGTWARLRQATDQRTFRYSFWFN